MLLEASSKPQERHRESLEDPEIRHIVRILQADPEAKHAVYNLLETKKNFERSLEIFRSYMNSKQKVEMMAGTPLPARGNNEAKETEKPG